MSFLFYNNTWTRWTLILILAQQILVAAGTYFLGKLSSEFPTQGFQLAPAIILFFCIFLPGTIVHYGVAWCTTRASKVAQLNYLTQYIQSNYNHPTHWRDETSKQKRHDIMCRGGQDSIQRALHFFVDSTATSLNIILNTISIIFVTNMSLGIIIIIAGFLGLSVIHFSEKRISSSSREEMLADNRLNAHLSCSWDNIILGNQVFFKRWKDHFKERFLYSEKAALETVRKRDWSVCIAGMITNGLVLGGALTLAWTHRMNAGFVLAILTMLPRSLQIVMHIQIIQTYLAQWKNLREKLTITRESLEEPKELDLNPWIQQEGINIKMNDQKYSLQDIENLVTKNKSGRITITGPNGSGKSCLLLALKHKFKLSAAYLPAHHQLIMKNAQISLSTGEIALAALNDIQSENCPILLLDEWDANLSTENRIKLDKIIDQISLERLVVEIRHFTDSLGLNKCAMN